MKSRKFWRKSKETFEEISPITIEPSTTSLKVGISRRFLLFRLFETLQRRMEDNPHLNFISNLKSYKLLGDVLTGTLHEFYRDRNNLYFKNFFEDAALYRTVKEDIRWVHEVAPQLKDTLQITITKRGVVMYDNYRKDSFNILLLTVHSGSWIRKDIRTKQTLRKKDRLLEEDIGTQHIYGPLVLEKGGIWIDNKASRFACDYNRAKENAIYTNKSEEWLDHVWHIELSDAEREWLLEGYDEFYHLLNSTVRSFQFNIIFDGHSMKDGPGRSSVSLGTGYIPKFYMPIVNAMLTKLRKLGHKDAGLDKPFIGGYILEWLKEKYPDRFIFMIEVNKRLYMTKDRKKVIEKKCSRLSKEILEIFDLDEVV